MFVALRQPVQQDYEPLAQILPDLIAHLDAPSKASPYYYYDVQSHSSYWSLLPYSQE
jgi:hypothetical protein